MRKRTFIDKRLPALRDESYDTARGVSATVDSQSNVVRQCEYVFAKLCLLRHPSYNHYMPSLWLPERKKTHLDRNGIPQMN